ncbi:hypothetical protein AB0M46_49465 [Dactylosporangium sp. NPDC051485]|uniref:hypothetical protein n=1 Tax=Dactylosporangium sp. NPDC051485 TaxID=3154846 RepID=UPI003445EF8D
MDARTDRRFSRFGGALAAGVRGVVPIDPATLLFAVARACSSRPGAAAASPHRATAVS